MTSTLLFLAALAVTPAPPPLTVIVGATLVDGGGRAPVADAIVVFRGATITAVGDRVHTPIPKGAALVDGRRMWIAPAPATPGVALVPAIAGLLRGTAARVRVDGPAHLALLDADPRPEGSTPGVRRLWISGTSREIPKETAR